MKNTCITAVGITSWSMVMSREVTTFCLLLAHKANISVSRVETLGLEHKHFVLISVETTLC